MIALAEFHTGSKFPFGGTSILIIVGVGLETVKQIESQLQQHNYEGFSLNALSCFVGPPGAARGPRPRSSPGGCPSAISTGDIFRANVGSGTPLGSRRRATWNAGQLVPDSITIGMVRDRLASGRATASCWTASRATWPRPRSSTRSWPASGPSSTWCSNSSWTTTSGQADRRTATVPQHSTHIFHVDFNPPREPAVCDVCGGELYQRDDDKEETVRERLAVYERETAPIVGFYAEARAALQHRRHGRAGRGHRAGAERPGRPLAHPGAESAAC